MRSVDGIKTRPGRRGELRELFKEALRRSLFGIVVIAPLFVVGAWVGEGWPLGRLTLGIQIAVAALLVLCEWALYFDKGWGSAIKGNLTDVLYVLTAASMDRASFVFCASVVASLGGNLSGRFQLNL